MGDINSFLESIIPVVAAPSAPTPPTIAAFFLVSLVNPRTNGEANLLTVYLEPFLIALANVGCIPGSIFVINLDKGLNTALLAACAPKLNALPDNFKPYFIPSGAALPITPNPAPSLVPSKPNLNLLFNLATAKSFPESPSSFSYLTSLMVSPLFPTINSVSPKVPAL